MHLAWLHRYVCMLYRDLLGLWLIESLREDARTRNTHARKHLRARTKTDKQTKMQTSKQCRESGKRVIGWSGRERERTGVCVPDVLKRWWSGSCHLSSAMRALQDLAAEEAYARTARQRVDKDRERGVYLFGGGSRGADHALSYYRLLTQAVRQRIRTRTEITATSLSHPDEVPQGWVQLTEPSGRFVSFSFPAVSTCVSREMRIHATEPSGRLVSSSFPAASSCVSRGTVPQAAAPPGK